jgi:hypothetical protein
MSRGYPHLCLALIATTIAYLAVSGPTSANQGSQGAKAPPPDIVKEILTKIADKLEKKGPDDKVIKMEIKDITPILKLTTSKLGMKLKEADERRAQKEWERYARNNAEVLQAGNALERGRRILIWVLQWLYRNGYTLADAREITPHHPACAPISRASHADTSGYSDSVQS